MIKEMQNRIVPISAASVAMVLSLLACAAPGKPAEVQQPAAKPAEFQVGPIILTPSRVMANDSVTVTTNITNTGGSQGRYTAVLTVDGKEAGRKDVSVEPGQSQQMSFEVPTGAVGEYKAAIGASSAIMKVLKGSPYEIKYDGGLLDFNATRFITGELGHFVRFTPPTTPFRIQKITVAGYKECSNDKDCAVKNFVVRVWNKDSSQQLWTQEFPWSLFGSGESYPELNVPNVRADDDFYVEIVTHSQPLLYKGGAEIRADICIGGSRPTSASVLARSGFSLNGKLTNSAPGVWMIRVKGEGAP